MDIGKCFKDAWGLYKADIGPLVVTALIAGAIVAIVSLIMSLVTGGGIAAVRLGGVGGGLGVATAIVCASSGRPTTTT
jgi:hypothetical protein